MKNDIKLHLAPLAGYSDVGFRTAAFLAGADSTCTEMLSAQAMKHDSAKTALMAITHPLEKCVSAQIFGHDPQVMAWAAAHEMLQKFDTIDINMGCPAHKVVRNGEGSALLKNLPLAGKIISECKSAIGDRKLTVKVRTGFDVPNVAEIIRTCQEAGADAICLHGRTTIQQYSGKSDLEAIALAKAVSKVPLIGNGDVKDKSSLEEMLSTGVDGVMIGRGAVGSPWIFSSLKDKKIDKFTLIQQHVDILRKYYDEKWLTLHLRKHFLAYAASFSAPASDKRKLALMSNIDEGIKILKNLFNHFEN